MTVPVAHGAIRSADLTWNALMVLGAVALIKARRVGCQLLVTRSDAYISSPPSASAGCASSGSSFRLQDRPHITYSARSLNNRSSDDEDESGPADFPSPLDGNSTALPNRNFPPAPSTRVGPRNNSGGVRRRTESLRGAFPEIATIPVSILRAWGRSWARRVELAPSAPIRTSPSTADPSSK